jgi:hypothetical protein
MLRGCVAATDGFSVATCGDEQAETTIVATATRHARQTRARARRPSPDAQPRKRREGPTGSRMPR